MKAITGGKIITMTGQELTGGLILIENGKILAVGENIKIPNHADVFDATGMIVMPGFIDAHTHVGIAEEVYRIEGDDVNENTDPVTPHLRAIDAVNPFDLGFKDALTAGVTTVITSPGSSNILGGEMAALKTLASTAVDDMVVKSPLGLKAALGENPKRSYGQNSKQPSTRMASAAILRETLVRGQDYLHKKELALANHREFNEHDLKMESVARVLRREIPLRIHAHRADDIMTALRIGTEFNLRLVIEHCTEGHLVADKLAAAGVPVVVGPMITNRAKVELKERSLETAAILARKGVHFAIMTDHPVVPVQYLPLSAGLAARGGLSEEKALRAITVDAARLLNLDDRIGSISPGKDGDIVILNGHPFDLRTIVKRVYVNGVPTEIN